MLLEKKIIYVKNANMLGKINDFKTVYAVGDIHGYHEQLIRIQKKIENDTRNSSGKKLLIYLGDYIDRGPYIKDCIQSLIDFKPPNFTIVYLLGNHEQMLLDFLADKKSSLYLWISNGGFETLESYGNRMDEYINSNMELSFDEKIRDKFVEFLPEEHKKFFYNLKLSYTWKDYFFVHAGIDPSVPLNKQTKQTMIWTRNDKFLKSNNSFEKIIIHGHTPSKKIVKKNNRICLDTGVFFTGLLTAIKIERPNKIEFINSL